MYIRLTLMGKAVPCLVDSGCETTLVPKTLIDSYRNVTVRPAATEVWAANDTPIQIDGETDLPFMLKDDCLWARALISDSIKEVMLGSDWLKTYNCIWDFGRGSLSIRGQPAVTLACRPVRADEESKDKQGASSSAGELMARLQQEDPDISCILQLRIQRKDQPRPEEMVSYSEAAKTLRSQWHSLVIINGVLYRRVGYNRNMANFRCCSLWYRLADEPNSSADATKE